MMTAKNMIQVGLSQTEGRKMMLIKLVMYHECIYTTCTHGVLSIIYHYYHLLVYSSEL